MVTWRHLNNLVPLVGLSLTTLISLYHNISRAGTIMISRWARDESHSRPRRLLILCSATSSLKAINRSRPRKLWSVSCFLLSMRDLKYWKKALHKSHPTLMWCTCTDMDGRHGEVRDMEMVVLAVYNMFYFIHISRFTLFSLTGGPMFWADNEVGLPRLLSRLEEFHTMYPGSTYFIPSKLLKRCVAMGVTVEEYYQKGLNKERNNSRL